ncbi:putative amidohydrolase YtcJ [Nocardioides ginsengisegetis]|uniref:Putative amidohydrolase YtcJ n=1 Tax=Nocardioides ginsengisegetis TaxID=661491 RepID=A0A7W3J259_9ACTN|nr:putative amidohydrolase YtcJ [Nocardioides ginsengisegetis]
MTDTAPALFLHRAEVYGVGTFDCRIQGGVITQLGRGLREQPGDAVVDVRGGALIPGLADHHLHLAAMAAHDQSIDLAGRPTDLALALRDCRPDESGWIRIVGYDDVAHGELDRYRLDTLTGDVPTRVQHRSGALWILNTVAVSRLEVAEAGQPGVERDGEGVPTGRLWRADHWLSEAVARSLPRRRDLSLRTVGKRLAACGVTHVADATPGVTHLKLVADAVSEGAVEQHVLLMTTAAWPHAHPRLTIGPAKLVVPDHEPLDLDGLVEQIRGAHARSRPVAIHCVTRAALALTLAAFDLAGTTRGDRIEHAAVAGHDLIAEVAKRDLTVVTQPSLVTRRGDDYWNRSDPEDRDDLWPYARLLDAGVRAAPSSDAPYGDADPWATLAASSSRRTRSGRLLGADERVAADVALRGMLSALDNPGGPPRAITVGAPADLVVLDRPLVEALEAPDKGCVRLTLISGRIVHDASSS